VVMVVDDAGTGRSQAVGGVVPDLWAWDHIPACGSGDLAVSARGSAPGSAWRGRSWWRTSVVAPAGSATSRRWSRGGRRSRAGGGGIRHGGCSPPSGDPCPGGGRRRRWGGPAGAGRRRLGSCGSTGPVARPLSRLRGPASRTAPTPASRPTSGRRGSTPWTDRPAPPGPTTRLGWQAHDPSGPSAGRVTPS
jgi:hypothetical protein